MSKRYVINDIRDIFQIPEDRIDDFLDDLKIYHQQALAWPELIDTIAGIGGVNIKTEVGPMVWIDDGKRTVTVKLGAKEEK